MKIYPATRNSRNRLTSLLVVGTLGLLSACSSSSTSDPSIPAGVYAYVATAGGGAGQIERYSLASNTQVGTYPATLTDLRVATDGASVYQIGRFNLDTLTKYDARNTSEEIFQYSVDGDETQSNPYEVIFVNETKAYVVRYGSAKVWIINPSVSAMEEEGFKIGELDLSAYDSGATPNASGAVLAGDNLYVLMERLDETFAPSSVGYVAVFDTITDEEINTGKGESGLLGIKLSTLNPGAIQYLEASDEIYVTGRGNIYGNTSVTGDPYQGGIETIDPATFDIDMLLDDGNQDDNNDFFSNALIVSPSVGYLITNSGFDPNTFASIDTLRAFNPTTGFLADEPIAGLVDTSIANLHIAPDGTLWVGVPGDAPGFNLIDTSTNMIIGEFLATTLAPLDVIFIDVPAN